MICQEYVVVVVDAIWAKVSAMAEEKSSLRFEETKRSRERGQVMKTVLMMQAISQIFLWLLGLAQIFF
jgi:hypothetical protein